MPESIRDGKGRGYLLEINREQKAEVQAIVVPEITHVSEVHGEAYSALTDKLTLGDTSVHQAFYMLNNSATKNIYIESVSIAWNGGSTNYNRTLHWAYYLATTAVPTANATSMTPGNINFASKNVSEGIFYKWDGVGTGMTVTTLGSVGGSIVGQGQTEIATAGAVILSLNDVATLAVAGEEVGDFALPVRYYFKNI